MNWRRIFRNLLWFNCGLVVAGVMMGIVFVVVISVRELELRELLMGLLIFEGVLLGSLIFVER